MKTVHTSNIYLSSDTGVKGTGTDFEVFLPAEGFTVKDGQSMRLTVQSMLGAKRFTDVNEYNNKFYIRKQPSEGADWDAEDVVYLTPTNHPDHHSLAEDFARQITLKCYANAATGTTRANRNVTSDTISGADFAGGASFDGKINVDVDIGTVHAIKVYFRRYFSDQDNTLVDTHLLLGGSNVDTTKHYETDITKVEDGMEISDYADATTENGVEVRGRTVKIKSIFPAVLRTMTHVYLRSSLVTDNHQNHHFDSSKYLYDGHVVGSDIMCKAPIHPDYFSFDDMNSEKTGYLVNIANRSITYLRFVLTTDKDQPLPNAAAHSVELVLRFDILEQD